MIKWNYSRDLRMVQNSQINQCDTPVNKRKDKDYVIISVDTEKTFDKIQHSLMIKTLNVDTEETYLNIIKSIYDKTKTNIILKSEKLNSFPLKSRIRYRCPLLPLYLTWYCKS